MHRPRIVASHTMATKAPASTKERQSWVVTFHTMPKMDEMKSALERSLFYNRLTGPKSVVAVDSRLVFSFTAKLTRQDVTKACGQQFKNCGVFASHTIVKGEPVCAEIVPPPASSTTLAVRNRVADIQRIADGLTVAENHSLAIFFGMQYAAAQRVSPARDQSTRMRVDKVAAAEVFTRPVAEWSRLLDEWSAKVLPLRSVKCGCTCGCRTLSCPGGVNHCVSSKAECCYQCHPMHIHSEAVKTLYRTSTCLDTVFRGTDRCCHRCANVLKLDTPIKPPSTESGMDWYFHFPWESEEPTFIGCHRPLRWNGTNRDTNLDPALIDVIEVRQTEYLTNDTKKLRPPGWESSFTVCALLGDSVGGRLAVTMNLHSFMMNPTWRNHFKIRYIEEEWVVHTKNHKYFGEVIKNPAYAESPADTFVPPMPQSPLENVLPIMDVQRDDPDTAEFYRLNAEAELAEARAGPSPIEFTRNTRQRTD